QCLKEVSTAYVLPRWRTDKRLSPLQVLAGNRAMQPAAAGKGAGWRCAGTLPAQSLYHKKTRHHRYRPTSPAASCRGRHHAVLSILVKRVYVFPMDQLNVLNIALPAGIPESRQSAVEVP